jgi:hypothetical protein
VLADSLAFSAVRRAGHRWASGNAIVTTEDLLSERGRLLEAFVERAKNRAADEIRYEASDRYRIRFKAQRLLLPPSSSAAYGPGSSPRCPDFVRGSVATTQPLGCSLCLPVSRFRSPRTGAERSGRDRDVPAWVGRSDQAVHPGFHIALAEAVAPVTAHDAVRAVAQASPADRERRTAATPAAVCATHARPSPEVSSDSGPCYGVRLDRRSAL